MIPQHLDQWLGIFPAKLTAAALSGGIWRYAFTEQIVVGSTGSYTDAEPARTGTTTISSARELNNRAINTSTSPLVWMRFRGVNDGDLVYEFNGLSLAGTDSVASVVETQWTANTDNYDPPDGAAVVDVSSNTEVSLTGMVLADDQVITLFNSGSYPIVIPDESGSSSAANQFDLPADGALILGPGDVVTFWHNPVTDTNVLIDTTAVIVRPSGADTIAANTNNYGTDPNTESSILTVNGDYNLTGMTGGVPGRTFTLTSSEASTGTLTLTHASGSSSVGNRFDLPGDVSYQLRPGESVTLQYSGAYGSGSWFVIDEQGGRPYAPTGVSGSSNNYTIPASTSMFVPTLSGDATFTGFAGGELGSSLLVTNQTGNSNTLTLTHDSGSSTATNRFDFSGGASITLSPGESISLIYDGSRWVDTGSSTAVAATGATRTEGTLAATGSTQGDAAAITTDAVVVSAADGTKGVILPNTEAAIVVIYNDAVSNLKVYPPSGAEINALGTDTAYSLATASSAVFYRLSSTRWTGATVI